jgi:hypothetical protein
MGFKRLLEDKIETLFQIKLFSFPYLAMLVEDFKRAGWDKKTNMVFDLFYEKSRNL